ncbi:AMP-binding protein [Aliamphritea hakodatensis]|uniref:AMP-binding protein n=1 Tax=Aliamphritea hakodatensis TaxID=2895352 RepID=UPI0022FD4584|nr:AMP-binding protein [Aliamphritea hakodatensis]
MNSTLYTPPAQSIRAVIEHFAASQPAQVFVRFPETGEQLTYAQLLGDVRRYAGYLAALEVKQGDTVSFMMGNGKTTLLLFLASLYAGCVSSPLNPAAGPDQIEYVLDHSDSCIVFTSDAFSDQVRGAAARLDRPVAIILCDVDKGPQWPAGTLPVQTPNLTVGAGDDGLLMYTSGTTGRPKGVILTHKNLLAGGMNTAVAHELSAADRALCVLPLCHINAQCVTVMAPLASGGSLVMPHSFSVSSFWGWVTDHGVSWFSVVPTIVSYLMHHEGPLSGDALKDALKGVRFGRSASAALPPALHAGFEEKFGIPLVETMGLTETSAQILSNPMPPKVNKYGSPGIAFGTEIKVVDEQGGEQPAGEEGELMVRGDCVMRCYYKNPDASAEALESDGWLHTGDLARQDEEGFIFITGRLKELIIKGGENIAPREIDDVLYSHPKVIEAGAVGVDDEHYGQEVVACVVTRESASVSADELIDFCRNKLGKIKTPKQIFFFDDLPKGPSGKVQRLKLVDQLKARQSI